MWRAQSPVLELFGKTIQGYALPLHLASLPGQEARRIQEEVLRLIAERIIQPLTGKHLPQQLMFKLSSCCEPSVTGCALFSLLLTVASQMVTFWQRSATSSHPCTGRQGSS